MLNDLQMANVTQEQIRNEFTSMHAQRKIKILPLKLSFSHQQWLKTQLKVTIEEPSSWSKTRAQENKRAKKKDQREMRAKSL